MKKYTKTSFISFYFKEKKQKRSLRVFELLRHGLGSLYLVISSETSSTSCEAVGKKK